MADTTFNNRNSRILTDTTADGRVVTRTALRSPGSIKTKVMTLNNGNGFTSLRISLPEGQDVFFDGAEARTIYRTLRNHFRNCGRSC